MSIPAVVPWVQWNELVVAEAEPSGMLDVTNRVAKFFVTQSDMAVGATFPGFMVRFTGISTPEGVIAAGSGAAFVDTAAQLLYLKATASGNTGWFTVGADLAGNGSPEGVITAAVGAIYAQRDAVATAQPNWIKRSGVGNTGWKKIFAGTGTNAIQVGDSDTPGNGQVAVGFTHTLNAAAVNFIALGSTITAAVGATSGGIAIGTSITLASTDNIGIGRSITGAATNTDLVAIGFAITVAPGTGHVLIGKNVHGGAAGTNVVIGNGASVSGGSGVCIGNAASIAGGGANACVAIGASTVTAAASSGNSVAIGNSQAQESHIVAIGSAIVSTFTGIGIGRTVTVSTGGLVAIGSTNTRAIASNAVALGSCQANHADTLVLGAGGVVSYQINTIMLAHDSSPYTTLHVGGGDLRSAPPALTFRMTNASGTNIVGGSMTIIPGRSTGNALASSFVVQIGDVLGSGTTLQTQTTKFVVNRTVAVGTAHAIETAFSVTLSTTASGGVCRGINNATTLVAAANNDVLSGCRIAPTITPGGFTGLVGIGLDIATITSAATNLAIRSATARSLFGTTTVNTFNTSGITVSQGADDNEIMTFKSSDVAHGMTTLTDTDSYSTITKFDAALGGVALAGYSDATAIVAIGMIARAGAGSTTKSTAALAPFNVVGSKANTTTEQALGADENIAVFRNLTNTRFILDGDGDSHQDVGTAWTNFDTHDDVALLNKLSAHVTRIDDPVRISFGEWLKSARHELEDLKLVTFNPDGHHFVNMSRLTMLHTGAIRQLGDRLSQMELVLEKLLPA